MHNPCVIIPVYNHFLKLPNIAARLADLDLAVFLLDDGSSEPCRQVLDDLSKQPGVTLLRWQKNRGKGAVVCDGLTKAFSDGYTHALQLDADGQHDLDDVENMLEKSRNYPLSVISACRDYDEMPKSRCRGRKLTDVWVWINTLSFTIKDSMCGFRVYPLAASIALLAKSNICQRMDFDTDIIVKLYWQGLEVEHLSSRIIYSDEIPSHFDVLHDNIRISLMHTKLFFGMIFRIPQLIIRKKARRGNEK
ncbi:MAG: glycosyl transferase [Alteromonadaceae bacterium]|nr:MAG: glycosyl transferase [Alteromonadaceae bacterium]